MKDQIQELEAKRVETEATKPADFINFSQIFNLSSVVKKNTDLNSLLQKSDVGKSIPLFIEESVNKEKDKYSNLDLLKFNIRQQGNGVYHSIRPYFTNLLKVRELTDKFFETELFSNYSYMNKLEFYKQFEEFFSRETIGKLTTNDYIFMGQLLIIMRIVFISYYNCGYDQEDESFFVGVEAFNLANICLEEARFPLYFQNIESMRLMLLLYECENYAPESVGLSFSLRPGSAQYLMRAGVSLKYNIDPLISDKDANYIRIIWNQILDIERTDLIYNGSSIFTDFDTYTTSLPILENDNSFQNIINKRFHDRSNNFKEIIFEISKMITNAKNPSTLNDYEKFLEQLVEKCNSCGLESILKLESNTKAQKCVKASKFVDFLDLHCLTFMLANHIFLYYNAKPDSVKKTQSIEKLINVANSMITLSYFIDPHQQHFYNLRQHFGHNIQLIPKILQNLHRLLQLQYTLLVKSIYQNSISPTFKLHEIKRIAFQNIKVIISSFGKISNRYLYAKRTYMIHSYSTLKVFGLNCDLSESFINLIKTETFHLFSETDYDLILKNLIELSGDRNLSENLYEEPLANYFEKLISANDTDPDLLSKPFSLEKIDEFLNNQTFLI